MADANIVLGSSMIKAILSMKMDFVAKRHSEPKFLELSTDAIRLLEAETELKISEGCAVLGLVVTENVANTCYLILIS
jgi:hypothetical protein